ncbi:hypothetical protein K2173_001220 [Erythroxylum novogranatense]|uniref:Uncharacterized protein n=1 Tax=Erythroxylum novogranatense TaxID=1862640 RepID=A0AAV8T463_9ROSI|nr:hypothetical protein K2173_001220 [Erythroxylum novogranatense]
MAACFFGEMSFVKPPASQVVKGIFVPKLSGQSIFSFCMLKGDDACRYFLMETGFALFVAFLINVSIVAVSGTVCFANNLSSDNANQCNNLTLDSASLDNVLGKSSLILYAVALLGAGQSAAVTSTFAGQFIMQGFLDLTTKKWIRNLVTRTIAIAPSLVVSIIGGSAGAGRLMIIASMMLSFEIPIVFIPLLRFSGSTAKMGPHKNSIYIIVASWILGMLIIGINVYYLVTGFIHWLLHNNLPKVGNICIGLKDTAVTYIEPAKSNTEAESKIESGELKSDPDSPETGEVQYRQDLTDVYHSE